MELNLVNLIFSTGAGLLSIASPCILPVLPIIIAGTEKDHRLRPLLISAGLSLSFILMGMISSLFGSLLAGKMLWIEKFSGLLFILFGILILFDTNFFKKITVFNRLQSQSKGKWSGLILGFTLGLIWIPCIGPMLSSILAMVAAHGQILQGATFLAFYSLGFALPILLTGYFSQFFKKKLRVFQKKPLLIRIFSSSLLIAFGMYIFFYGMMGF